MLKKKSKSTAITQPKQAAPTTELATLIEKLQKTADKVEKNIYDVEQNLNKDVSKINEGKQPLYQEDTNKRLLSSLELLSSLDEDVVNARRLQHPQAEMIAQDMKQLRDRVMKLKEEHGHIYHLVRTEGKPSINWGNMMDEKLDNLQNKGFGQDLPSVENEVEEHNIFHSEVEALAPHISASGDKEYVSSLQEKYNKLLANSSARQRHLTSLRDYMQRCTNELYWMDQQAEERIKYDWSDNNLDYPARQRQYENFISKCLESKEGTITKLNDDGEKLIASDHPGKNVLEVPTITFDSFIARSRLGSGSTGICDFRSSVHVMNMFSCPLTLLHVASDKQEQQCRQLMAGLDKVVSDLDKQEKSIYARVRPPLEQNRSLQDSTDRLQDMKDITAAVRRIEPEKSSKVQEAQSFLVSNPSCASTSQLHSKVDEANKKYTKVEQLLQCSQEKLKNSNQLESSLQNGKTFLSTYENKLAREEVAPADVSSMEKTQRELADIGADLRSQRTLISDTEQNLRLAKSSCENMANKFQEHCPDIERQEADVLRLNKRYNNLNQQTDSRAQSLQRAKMAYKNYRNDYDNLNSWLSRVPNYEPRDTDDPKQVETKLRNQRNLLSDLARKESDLNNVSKNAQLYQQAVKDYETEAEKFKSILDLEDGLVPQTYKRSRLESPAATVKAEEAAIEAKFTEVNAVNKQRLQNLEFASSLLSQQSETIQVTNVKSVQASAPGEEPWRIRKQLEDEIHRREQLEKEIETIQTDIYMLEGQKPQDTIVKKELIKKVPDPQLDEELYKVQQKLSEERRTTHVLENDLEVLKLKLRGLETEVKEGAQQYTVKEVLRIERDRGQEEAVRKLREELEELKRQRLIKDNELIEIQKHVTLLAEEKSKEQEVITEEEVIKVQNDPQLESEYRVLLDRKEKEIESRRQLEDELQFLQEKLRRLEKEKSMAEEKISIKEVLKVEKDTAFEREVENLRRQYEDEKAKRRSSQREKTDLQRKIASLEEDKSKVVIQEKVREIVRPDPKAENEVANLRLELVEHQRRYKDAEFQLRSLEDELAMLKNRGPQVEVKEIIKEVIKYKIDPQTERELERLRNEIVDKSHQTEKSELEIRQLRDEIERWKNTKPQVQTREIINEVKQYREDPKTKEEIEMLKRKLADEQQKRLDLERERTEQEERIRLRKMDLSQVREKIVQEEVVKMEEDPLLKSECDSFLQNINNEQKQKESLKTELYQLERQKTDLDMQLEELERERRARRDAELEIQRLRVRLNELEIRDKENREKVTVKQKVVLQQDPQQEKEHSILKLQLDEERHKRTLLEKELNVLIQQQITLEKVDVKERVVRTEKVQVERDPEAEIEIENLKITLEEEKRRRRELDQELSTLNSRLSDMEFSNTKSTKELDYIRDESSRLQQENQRLQNEIRKLRSEIDITSKETRLITESAPREDSKNLELRLDSLQKELAELRAVTNQKEEEIEKLKKNLAAVRIKREQRESHLRRSIVVIDPDTGKEMRPEEAYKLGLIDWKMFVNLQSQECDWEEISVKGPQGESSVLHDRKSGKKFSIDDALCLGHITNRQLQQYLNKEISIQEFGALVSGKNTGL
ncbi:periplakin [Neolamprologus brichardi]|uniref:periplakin n=1 Tax=Neolamprologus brichardi TaxID=32507 RepID=UPI001643D0F1|nr:periplakin [Neolamprologus brichardi]